VKKESKGGRKEGGESEGGGGGESEGTEEGDVNMEVKGRVKEGSGPERMESGG